MLITLPLTDALQAISLLQLQRLAYAQEAALIDYPHLPPLHETLPVLMDCGETVLGWRDGENLLGALAYTETADEVAICRMVVNPFAQRCGIARRLLAECLTRAAGRRVKVGTAAANLPAIALYQSAGFVIYQQFATPDGLTLVALQYFPTPDKPAKIDHPAH